MSKNKKLFIFPKDLIISLALSKMGERGYITRLELYDFISFVRENMSDDIILVVDERAFERDIFNSTTINLVGETFTFRKDDLSDLESNTSLLYDLANKFNATNNTKYKSKSINNKILSHQQFAELYFAVSAHSSEGSFYNIKNKGHLPRKYLELIGNHINDILSDFDSIFDVGLYCQNPNFFLKELQKAFSQFCINNDKTAQYNFDNDFIIIDFSSEELEIILSKYNDDQKLEMAKFCWKICHPQNVDALPKVKQFYCGNKGKFLDI